MGRVVGTFIQPERVYMLSLSRPRLGGVDRERAQRGNEPSRSDGGRERERGRWKEGGRGRHRGRGREGEAEADAQGEGGETEAHSAQAPP